MTAMQMEIEHLKIERGQEKKEWRAKERFERHPNAKK